MFLTNPTPGPFGKPSVRVTENLRGPLHDILKKLRHGTYYEYDVLEYELRQQYPALFGQHVSERGHKILGSPKPTASNLFAIALVGVERDGDVTHITASATGAWRRYQATVSFWALSPTAHAPILTWEQYCHDYGLDPMWTEDDHAAVAALVEQNQATP